MSTPLSQTSVATLTPARGIRVYSVPCDPATFIGVSGIHWNRQLAAVECLWGIPLALQATGAVYFSPIHGALGSDDVAPGATPTLDQNGAYPAFPGPEVTGYYTTGPNMGNAKTNGFLNTEKIQRAPSDNPAGDGTIWQAIQGRNRLNFALWIAPVAPTDFVQLSLYQDLNVQDKTAGVFGPGTGPTDPDNAMLIGQWTAQGAAVNQNLPNLVTNGGFEIPAGCNLYLVFRNLQGNGSNVAVGSIWLT